MSKNDIPFFAIGNNELDQKAEIGFFAGCKRCGKKHKVKYGTSRRLLEDGTYSEPFKSTLGFINCGNKTFLVSVEGKEL